MEEIFKPCYERVKMTTPFGLAMGLISLTPIFDMGTDVVAIVDFIENGHVWWTSWAILILVLNWRFGMLFATFHPKPTLWTIMIFYVPGLLLPFFEDAMAVTTDNEQGAQGPAMSSASVHPIGSGSGAPESVEDVLSIQVNDERQQDSLGPASSSMSAHPTGSGKGGASSSNNDQEDNDGNLWASGSVLQMLVYNLVTTTMQCNKGSQPVVHVLLGIMLEPVFAVLCLFIGPACTIVAALTLAAESSYHARQNLMRCPPHCMVAAETDKDDVFEQHEKHKLYNKVLCVIEALCESFPQLLLQLWIFAIRDESTAWVFGMSATTGLLSIAWSTFVFLKDRATIMSTLVPRMRTAQSCASANDQRALDTWCKNNTTVTKLDFRSCTALTALPESFGQLTNLEMLNMQGCEKLVSLPESFGELPLTVLDLGYCHKLDQVKILQLVINKFMGLTQLGLAGWKITELTEGFGQLVNLQSLNLWSCTSLTSLPESFGELRSLQSLDMSYCVKVESLPESFGQLINLKELDLRCCEQLKSLPESFGKLDKLKKLDLRHCPAAEGRGLLAQLKNKLVAQA